MTDDEIEQLLNRIDTETGADLRADARRMLADALRQQRELGRADKQQELELVRAVLNTDLKIASERAMTLEMGYQRLEAKLAEAQQQLEALTAKVKKR